MLKSAMSGLRLLDQVKESPFVKAGLNRLGWTPDWADKFARLAQPGWHAARITRQDRGGYRLGLAESEGFGFLPGRWRAGGSAVPVIGDWVAVSTPDQEGRLRIEALLERENRLARQAPGKRTDIQVLAANVSILFVVTGLDGDFNLRRLQRYLALAFECRCRPVIVLNKADLDRHKADHAYQQVAAMAGAGNIVVSSAKTCEGLEQIQCCMRPGETVAFLGSSGVGKSTLLNALLGEGRQKVQNVRERDDRGLHTTTVREIFSLANGALVIDSPGIREVAVWREPKPMDRAGNFSDIEALAQDCRFSDCRHINEPGCAVQAALQAGEITDEHLTGYRRVLAETEQLADRQTQAEKRDQKRRRKLLHKPKRGGAIEIEEE